MNRPVWLIFLLTLPVFASAQVEMEVVAGLSGQAVTGYANEIAIRLFATSSIVGELQILDANGLQLIPVILDEQKEKKLHLNVRPKPLGAVQVNFKTSSGTVIDQELVFEQARTKMTIISTTTAYKPLQEQQTRAIRPVILPAESLPYTFQVYDSIKALVIDEQSLSGLSVQQYRALSHYLKGCNILLVSITRQVVLQKLRNISACGGEYIQPFQELAEVSDLLQRLSLQRAPALPSAQNLLTLRQTEFQQRMTHAISWFLGGYILFMALVNGRIQNRLYLLLLPVIVTTACLVVWMGNGTSRLISWAEVESGDSYVRATGILQMGGDRRGESRFIMAADSLLSPIAKMTQHAVIMHNERNSRRELITSASFLTPQVFQLSYIEQLSPAYNLLSKQGIPLVILSGEKPAEKVRLLWRGHTYALPLLNKGEAWQPVETEKQKSKSPEEKLLHRRLSYDSPALLLPFQAGSRILDTNSVQSSGWLVIRQQHLLRL